MANSSRSSVNRKAAVFSERKHAAGVPADFPLHIHASGRWAKKVRGKRHYFGNHAADPKGEAALLLYLEQKDDLHAGRKPRSKDGLTILEMCTQFLLAKQKLRESGEIVERTFRDQKDICKRLVKHFGPDRLVDDLRSEDFDKFRAVAARQGGHIHVGNMVQRTRTVFKYAFEAGLIAVPMRFGPSFKKPNKKTLRQAKAKQPKKLYEAAEIQTLLDSADVQLRAMILLGVNCGFGNADVGTLPLSVLNLKAGWIDYPRPKTAIDRRCPLWPETVAAVKEAIAKRPAPKQLGIEHLVFITKYGKSWHKETEDSPVCKEFKKLLDEVKLHKPGRGFYSLRHTFETIAGGCRDQIAVNWIMGHVDPSMAAQYRETIEDDRLKEAAEYVHRWLFPTTRKGRTRRQASAASA